MNTLANYIPALRQKEIDRKARATKEIIDAQIDALEEEIQACKKCIISSMPVNVLGKGKGFGKLPMHKGNKPWLIIGINPSINRYEDFKAFCGRTTGDVLADLLAEAGFSKKDFYITNTLKCSTTNNRPPDVLEISSCRHWLDKELDIIQPELVVLLGKVPSEALNAHLPVSVKNFIYGEAVVVTLPHPSYVIRKPETKILYQKRLNDALAMMRQRNCQQE